MTGRRLAARATRPRGPSLERTAARHRDRHLSTAFGRDHRRGGLARAGRGEVRARTLLEQRAGEGRVRHRADAESRIVGLIRNLDHADRGRRVFEAAMMMKMLAGMMPERRAPDEVVGHVANERARGSPVDAAMKRGPAAPYR